MRSRLLLTLFFAGLIAGLSSLSIKSAFSQRKTQAPFQAKTTNQAPALSLPLIFESNEGQAAKQFQYIARSGGYTALFSPQEALLAFHSRPSETQGSPHLLRLRLAGKAANHWPEISGEEALASVIRDYRTEQPIEPRTWQRVRYKNAYPGIDLVFYGNPSRLQYDFKLAPQADLRQIHLRLTGASNADLDSEGNLLVSVGRGDNQNTISWSRPVCYQEVEGQRTSFQGDFVLSKVGGEFDLAFSVKGYDPRYPLVIDPQILWATYFGGSGNDSFIAVAADSFGNVCITGETYSPNLPTYVGNDPPYH